MEPYSRFLDQISDYFTAMSLAAVDMTMGPKVCIVKAQSYGRYKTTSKPSKIGSRQEPNSKISPQSFFNARLVKHLLVIHK